MKKRTFTDNVQDPNYPPAHAHTINLRRQPFEKEETDINDKFIEC